MTALGPPVRIHAGKAPAAAGAGPPPALGDAAPTWIGDDALPRRAAPRPRGRRRNSTGGVLDGVTILDLTRILPGPLAGRHLAELGADVTKIEPPGGEEGYAIPFMYLEGNRSKSSIEIDLRDEAGRKQFRGARARSGRRDRERARRGVGRDGARGGRPPRAQPAPDLRAAKGYGLEGPYAGLRAFEHVLQAMTGMQMTQGGSGAPRMMTIPASDYASPLYLSIGILCSLFAGRRSDTWPTVSASLAVAASVYEAEHLTRIDGTRAVRDDVGDDLHGPSADRHIYRLADGWVTVFAVSPESARHARGGPRRRPDRRPGARGRVARPVGGRRGRRAHGGRRPRGPERRAPGGRLRSPGRGVRPAGHASSTRRSAGWCRSGSPTPSPATARGCAAPRPASPVTSRCGPPRSPARSPADEI